jgi:hypothetical protein
VSPASASVALPLSAKGVRAGIVNPVGRFAVLITGAWLGLDVLTEQLPLPLV